MWARLSGRRVVAAVVALVGGGLAWVAGPRWGAAIATTGVLAGVFLLTEILRRDRRWLAHELDRLHRSTDVTAGTGRLARAQRHEFAQTQALVNLYAMVPVSAAMPALRTSWSASPDVVLLIASLVRDRRPATIVDLGSGASTVWMASALRTFGVAGRVVSIDHDADFAAATCEAVRAAGLESFVDVRVAPLTDVTLAGEVFSWYDRSVLADIDLCDLLFVDGPPGTVGPTARYPALPVLHSCLAAGAAVVVDDYDRPDERAMVARWRESFPDLLVQELPLEKGAALLTRAPAGAPPPGAPPSGTA